MTVTWGPYGQVYTYTCPAKAGVVWSTPGITGETVMVWDWRR